MSDYDEEVYDDMYYQDEFPTPGLNTGNSSVPPSKVKVEEMDGIHFKLKESVGQVNELVALGKDWSLILFAYYKWNNERLQADYFLMQEKVLKEIHYTNIKPSTEHGQRVCETCYGVESTFVRNYCGHSFCQECWKEYVSLNINNKVVFIRCMKENCPCTLLESTVEEIISSSPSTLQKYAKYLCQRFVETNHNIKFCPGADCKYCIYSENPFLNEVECYCGYKFCFRCRSEVHRPCSCSDVVKWKEIVMKEEANATWLTLNTKICPFCKKHVERSMGCNYMMCAPPGGCGKAFCYVCSKSWQPDHKDHFKCNVYKPTNKDNQNIEKSKQILAKINFFCQKYLTNQHSKKKIAEVGQKMPEYQTELFNILGLQLNESEFIVNAYRFAGQACDGLKWSYAYGFFMGQNFPKSKKELFEFQQGEFEKWKENLTVKLDQKFNKLVESMIEDKKEKRPIDVEQRLKEFHEIKTDIITYYKASEVEMKKLVQMVEGEL